MIILLSAIQPMPTRVLLSLHFAVWYIFAKLYMLCCLHGQLLSSQALARTFLQEELTWYAEEPIPKAIFFKVAFEQSIGPPGRSAFATLLAAFFAMLVATLFTTLLDGVLGTWQETAGKAANDESANMEHT